MKMLEGKVVSTLMKNTVIVKVTRYVTHPLYKKLLKRSKNYKVETKGIKVNVGDLVKIVEVKPISKDKHFNISDSVKLSSSVVARKTLNEKPVTTEGQKKSEIQKIKEET